MQHPAGRRGVGTTERGSRPASECRRRCLLTRDRLLGGQGGGRGAGQARGKHRQIDQALRE